MSDVNINLSGTRHKCYWVVGHFEHPVLRNSSDCMLNKWSCLIMDKYCLIYEFYKDAKSHNQAYNHYGKFFKP